MICDDDPKMPSQEEIQKLPQVHKSALGDRSRSPHIERRFSDPPVTSTINPRGEVKSDVVKSDVLKK